MGPFPNALIGRPFCKFLDILDLLGKPSHTPITVETGSPAYTRTCLAQSSDVEIKANTNYLGSLISEMQRAPLSGIGNRELNSLFRFHGHAITIAFGPIIFSETSCHRISR